MAKSPPLIIEQPSKTVCRPATFYCKMGVTLDGHLSFEHLAKPPYYPPRGILASPEESPLFDIQAMPPEVGPQWMHARFLETEENLAQYASDLKLVADYVVEHIPDLFAWPPFGIVSERARLLLDDIDPDGSIFLNVSLTKSDGSPVPGRYFHWIQRNILIPREDRARKPLKPHRLPFSGPFSRPRVAGELVNKDALRLYLQRLPFWCLHLNFLYPVFSSSCFEELKMAGLTGLVENTAEFAGDRKLHESIGHIV